MTKIFITTSFGLRQAASRAAAMYIDGFDHISRIQQPSDVIEKHLCVQFVGERHV
jgi:hypothetical protein